MHSIVRLRRHHLLPFGLALLVGGISVLHYVTGVQSIVLHEIFKRLYYVPIVIAAIAYGVRGGAITSIGASLIFLPHVAVDWRDRPALEFERYAEVLLFNVVAVVAGVLADRLRAERNRHRQAAAELRDAYVHLKVQSEERLRVERLVTVGRLAAGLGHTESEIRSEGCSGASRSSNPSSRRPTQSGSSSRSPGRRSGGSTPSSPSSSSSRSRPLHTHGGSIWRS